MLNNEAVLIHQPAPVYSQPALDLLSAYHWPRNVRELKNLVKRMMILKPEKKVLISDIEKMIDMDKKTAQWTISLFPP